MTTVADCQHSSLSGDEGPLGDQLVMDVAWWRCHDCDAVVPDRALVDDVARELMRQRVGQDLWDQYDDADTGPRWLWRDDARRLLGALGAVRARHAARTAFITCLECGHIYPTAADLVLADVMWQVEGRENGWGPKPEARPAEQIDSCPVCTHSF